MQNNQIEAIYSLSPLQEGMLYHKMLAEDSTVYILRETIKYNGNLHVSHVKLALQLLTVKYDVLRTAFAMPKKSQKPWQVILKDREVEFVVKDLTEMDDPIKLQEIERLKAADLQLGFDLFKDSLLRVTLITISDTETMILWCSHHIIMDGWCNALLLKDFIHYYERLEKGELFQMILQQVTEEKKQIASYRDFIQWLEKQDKEKALNYWENLINDYTEAATIMPLGTAKSSPGEVAVEKLLLEKNVTNKLKAIASKQKITVNTLLETAWGILLQKYNRTNDVIFGKVVSGRNADIPGIEKAVGLFINTIPVRVKVDSHSTLRELLNDMQQQALESMSHDYCSLAEIQNRSSLNRGFIQSLFVFENYYVDEQGINQSIESLGTDIVIEEAREETNYPLTVSAYLGESLHLEIMFQTNEYTHQEINLLLKRLTVILEAMTESLDQQVAELTVVDEAEQKLVLDIFNQTNEEFTNQTVIELFEKQVEETPNQIAIYYGDKKITYKELNERVNQLARKLRREGIAKQDLVALICEKSIEMIIGIYSIIKAGGAYVPINPTFPKEQINYILKDSQSKLALVGKNIDIDPLLIERKQIHLFDEDNYVGDTSNVSMVSEPNDLIYCIYTSGTTGRPKGTLIEHRGVSNLVQAYFQLYDMSEKDVLLQFASISFDSSAWDIFTILSIGGALCIPTEEIRADSVALEKYIHKYKVSVAALTPALINELNPTNVPTLIKLESGGAAANPQVLEKWLPNRKIFNTYGPTEATVNASTFECKHVAKRYPIGRPIPNTKIYILNNQQICGIGMLGELCITEANVARGYLNKDELTKEKFVENPFGKGKMYRTGDLARWLPDGNIDYLGRIDEQVKIRGFRIELGEVESVIRELPTVQDISVVTIEDQTGEKIVCAYIVPDDSFDEDGIREALVDLLPDYMIPTYFVSVERIPLTNNGKVDKRKLPKIETKRKMEYSPPRDELETKLVHIFENILGTQPIGIYDDFFRMGGHSLRATRTVNQIDAITGVRLSIKEIFSYPTVEAISKRIKETKKESYTPIPKAVEKEMYSMSSQQKRIYFVQHLETKTTAYNMPSAIEVDGVLNRNRVQIACNKLIERHEILRTSFHMKEGVPVQRIEKDCKLSIEYKEMDITDQPIEEIAKEALLAFVQPFELQSAPLLRVKLIQWNQRKSLLLFDMHHIISDADTFTIISQDFLRFYNEEELPTLKLQYKDYSEWVQGKEMEKQKEFWIQQFSEATPLINLPYDFTRPKLQSFRGSSFSITVPKETKQKITTICRETKTTEYMVLLSAFMLLLYKYTRQSDLVVGSPISGRVHRDTERMAGMFVNTLALRGKVNGNHTFQEFLSDMKELCIRAFENQDFPFEELVENVAKGNDLSRNPLFDVMFVLQNNEEGKEINQDLSFRTLDIAPEIAKFDLTLNVNNGKEGYVFIWEYCADLFEKDTVERMSQQYLSLINAIHRNLSHTMDEIEIITEMEKNKLVIDFNRTDVNYPLEHTLIELFEKQVEKFPQAIAIQTAEVDITYQELDEDSNKIANKLMELGVKRHQVVAISLPRSGELIKAILAVLKCDCAFLPIDPDIPTERKQFILDDSQAIFFITDHKALPFLISKDCVHLSNEALLQTTQVERPSIQRSLESPCYYIYTSGSTGVPKGVQILDRNLLNYLYYCEERYVIGNPIMPLFTNISFDLTITSLFVPLLFGGKLFIYNRGGMEDLPAIFENEELTIIKLTPSHLKLACESKSQKIRKNLTCLIVGGEALHSKIAQTAIEMYGDHIQLHNEYGPTETTIGCCDYVFKSTDTDRDVLIGKPIPNMKMYILNNLQLCGIGMVGELCIAGAGVSIGYVNRPTLTNEKFIENPIVKGERLYRTGDLARWLPDGNIEFLGRMDDQIKIRGYRVEIREIEEKIRDMEFIKEAVVIAKEKDGEEKEIYAYFTSNIQVQIEDVKDTLRNELPEYMVPPYMMQIPFIPITSNGKVDKKKLPDIKLKGNRLFVEPRNDIEVQLIILFKEILEVNEVSIKDRFFELGGHSLKAMRLVNRIDERLGKRLSLLDIFTHQTVEKLAFVINDQKKTTYTPIPRAEEKPYYHMSSQQRRLCVIQQMDPFSIAYNMPIALEIDEVLDVSHLKQVMHQLMNRHEIVRTSFHLVDDEPMQRIEDDISIEIGYEEIADETKQRKEAIFHGFVQAFELNKAPLLRMKVVSINNKSSLLLFDMHHIISDGISMNQFIQEFLSLFNGREDEGLSKSYKDYSEWMMTRDITNQKNYWLNEFKDSIEPLELPLDFVRPQIRSFQGKSITKILDATLSKQIREFSQNTDTTDFMILLSGLMILLAKYSRQDDIVIGSPVSGRTHPDTEKMLGMFVNTLPLRGYPNKDKRCIDFLNEVKEKALNAYEHQEYPLEELLEEIEVIRELSRNPLFDVMFSLEIVEDETFPMKDNRFRKVEVEENITKFDLSVSIAESKRGLLVNFEYSRELFKEETIQYMMNHYIIILKEMIHNPKERIGSLSVLNQEEKEEVLEKFNDTEKIYQQHETFIDLFEETVERNPQKVAIVWEEEKITYKELDQKANQLARRLRAIHVGRDCLVGIVCEKSIEMIIGVLGVIKAGGAYVPIDSRYPKERIHYMIQDSQPYAILTGNEMKDIEVDIPRINLFDQEIYTGDASSLDKINHPNDLLYVIYTSGTTGRPKGTLIEHHGIVNLVSDAAIYSLSKEDTVLQFASFSFDQSAWDILVTLATGACLCLVPPPIMEDIPAFEQYVNKYNVTFASLTPAFINELEPEKFPTIRVLESGGAEANPAILRKWINKRKVFNTYGPTETTVNATYYQVEGNRMKYPIGKPISNTKVYILDGEAVCGVTIPGELCIAGAGMARGYLNREELTKEKFIDNPFGNGKLYRTGDLARWLPDGNIEYLGRIDEQVKIRGFRMEIGEIESAIRSLEDIDQAVVTLIDLNNHEKNLCAYYVARKELTKGELKGELQKRLPHYMIPAYFMQIDKIPMTRNGKIDKQQLPSIDQMVENNTISPRNELEMEISEIWGQVLNRMAINNIDEDFFLIGGDSIKAIRVVSELKAKGYIVSVRDIFTNATIRQLAAFLTNNLTNLHVGMAKSEDNREEEMSQTTYKELDALVQLYDNNIVSNKVIRKYTMIPMQQQFDHPENKPIMHAITINDFYTMDEVILALKQMITEYDVLRSTLSEQDKQLITEYEYNDTWIIPIIEKEKLMHVENYLTDIVSKKEHFANPNKLLVKFFLTHSVEGQITLYIFANHFVWDAMSNDVFTEQFKLCLQGQPFVEHNDFYSYVQEIKQINRKQKMLSLLKYHKIRQLLLHFRSFSKAVSKQPTLAHVELSIKVSPKIIRFYEKYPLDFYLYLLSKTVFKNMDVKTIPFLLLYHGREGTIRDYSNGLGLFIDFVPFSYKRTMKLVEKNVQNEMDKILSIRNKERIHFITLFSTDTAEQEKGTGWKANDIETINSVPLPVINFLGIYESSLSSVEKVEIRGEQNNFIFEMEHSEEMLHFRLSCFKEMTETIFEVFKTEINEIEKLIHEEITI